MEELMTLMRYASQCAECVCLMSPVYTLTELKALTESLCGIHCRHLCLAPAYAVLRNGCAGYA